jgi:hypothetical protein
MKKPSTLNNATKSERTVDEAIQILWRVIEEAKMGLVDERSTSEDKRQWAKVLCDTVGVLNKLLQSKGEKPLEDEDLGAVLQKVPRRFRVTILKGVRKWRKTNF